MFLKPAALTAAVVLACTLSAPQIADATVGANGGAAAICKAASGPGAQVFYFDTTGVLNTSASTQYLTCDVPDIDGGAGGSDAEQIWIHYINNTASAVSFTCVIQTIHSGNAAVSAIYTENVAANTPHYFTAYIPSSTPALPTRGSDAFYTVSCAIPAGAALGSVKAYWPGNLAP